MQTSAMQTSSRGFVSRASRRSAVRVAAYKNSGELRHQQEVYLRNILTTYTKAHSFFPRVKFVMKHNSRLGEVWKLTGSSPELGAWVPEVSPCFTWSEGGIWTAEVALPPGTYTFKCALRTAEGCYVWETGENRHLLVPMKERAGALVLNYHMDVRTEPVESPFTLTPSKYAQLRPGEAQELLPLDLPSNSNGRVLVGANSRR